MVYILFPLLVCHTFTTEGPPPVNNRQDGDVQVQHITTFKALIYSFFWFTLINQNYNKIFSNVIGHHQPDLCNNRTVSCHAHNWRA